MPPKTSRKRIVLCGEKGIAERCLDFLHGRQDTEICAIIAAPQDWQADLIAWGLKRRIKVYVGNINHYVDELALLQPDFIFSVQYRRLLRPPILRLPQHGCINLHFGLLPRYGGCYPIAWAILNGESQAGATLHYMSETFDEGDVIAQCAVPIDPNTTARDLFDALSDRAADLFAQTYAALCQQNIAACEQDLRDQLYYTKDSIDFVNDLWIDWHQAGIAVQRRVCAFTFEPFQLPSTGIRLPSGRDIAATVTRTRLYNSRDQMAAGKPGQVATVTANGAIVVGTGNGEWIEIGELNGQPARGFIESLGLRPQEVVLI
jgi:methionyl-tRNA formyltransferase